MFNVAPYLLLIRLVVWACCCGPRVQTVRWILVSNSRARVVTYMSHVEAFVTAGSKLNQAVKAKFWEPIKESNRKNKKIKTCGYSLTFDLLKIKWSRATIILILVTNASTGLTTPWNFFVHLLTRYTVGPQQGLKGCHQVKRLQSQSVTMAQPCWTRLL